MPDSTPIHISLQYSIGFRFFCPTLPNIFNIRMPLSHSPYFKTSNPPAQDLLVLPRLLSSNSRISAVQQIPNICGLIISSLNMWMCSIVAYPYSEDSSRYLVPWLQLQSGILRIVINRSFVSMNSIYSLLPSTSCHKSISAAPFPTIQSSEILRSRIFPSLQCISSPLWRSSISCDLRYSL